METEEFEAHRKQANQALKDGRLPVSIQRKRGRDGLYLKATLPPKPGSGRTEPYQQEIAVGVKANLFGLRRAIAEAQRLGAAISLKQFRWEDWGVTAPDPQILAKDAIARFEERRRSAVSYNTWRRTYAPVLKSLPDGILTAKALEDLVNRWGPRQRSRQIYAMVVRQLAEQEGLTITIDPGRYSERDRTIRRLPTDEEIAAIHGSIDCAAWRRLYGILACYGLRAHEVFFSKIARDGVLTVTSGKTGQRQVWPIYPEWVKAWKLNDGPLPEIKGSYHGALGERVCRHFHRHRWGVPGNLRHRWAVRASEYGLPVELAARQMGHSLSVHTRTYQQWLTAATHRKVAAALLEREDRPQAPI